MSKNKCPNCMGDGGYFRSDNNRVIFFTCKKCVGTGKAKIETYQSFWTTEPPKATGWYPIICSDNTEFVIWFCGADCACNSNLSIKYWAIEPIRFPAPPEEVKNV